ncbi:hypothetical protein V5O48_014436 [Marasmius crinis-equi]|uniref:Zn(2)-C6 fungal-type domain-containing protein n=1 Tax=Marasmius crinis-equi TaxID=585013 RepID=A0ABR3EXC5_9AGAR
MSTAPKPKPVRKRSHKGCLQCKKRRKKCDEAKPICGSCERRGADCIYTEIHSRRKSRNVSGVESGDLPSHSSNTSQVTEQRVTLRRQPTPTPIDSLDMMSLKLFHHYIFVTTDTLSCTGSLLHSLKFAVPQLAFPNPCLMSGLLTIASFHMHHLLPSADEDYLALAISRKQQLDLTMRTQRIPPDIYYLTMAFVRFFQFTETATASHLDILSWISSYYHSFWRSRDSSPDWDSYLNNKFSWIDMQQLTGESEDIPFPESLKVVHLSTSNYPDPDEVDDPATSEIYKQASDRLAEAWLLFQRPGFESFAASAWPFNFTEEFHQFLVIERRPRALTLLYYYCSMLCWLLKKRGVWWLGGFANSMDDVVLMLDEPWVDCITQSQLGSEP